MPFEEYAKELPWCRWVHIFETARTVGYHLVKIFGPSYGVMGFTVNQGGPSSARMKSTNSLILAAQFGHPQLLGPRTHGRGWNLER